MTFFKHDSFMPYVLPFIVFALFIYLPALTGIEEIYLYPVKTIVTGSLLIYFWSFYKHEITVSLDLSCVSAGILVFIIWVGMEGIYPKIGQDSVFNPFVIDKENLSYVIIGFKLFGTIIVVPIVEELFWRSFALRFLINKDFKKVALGTFSWFSFIFGSIAFGLEHHRWLPGIIAGFIYSILLYQKKNLFAPIVAHSVTNLLIGVYVIVHNQWFYW